MNKAKLVNLAEEVLTDIDTGIKTDLRFSLEKELVQRLKRRFQQAQFYLEGDIKFKKTYESVKPILDEAIDKLLDRSKKWDFGEKFTT